MTTLPNRLNPEEQNDLIRKIRNTADPKGVKAAKDTLVLGSLGLVKSLAKRYRGIGISWDDLVQDGTLGLYDAIERFDPDRGIRFVTYAVYWIRLRLQESVVHQSSPVALPRQVYFRYRKGRASDLHPTEARSVSISPKTYRSVDQWWDASPADFLDTLIAHIPDPDSDVLDAHRLRRIIAMRGLLTPDQQMILMRWSGLDGGVGETYADIGRTFSPTRSLSRERVSKLAQHALARVAWYVKHYPVVKEDFRWILQQPRLTP